MKYLLNLICLLIFFCDASNAQSIPAKTKEDSVLYEIPDHVQTKSGDTTILSKATKSPCSCVGSGFDTCCPIKQECCETKLIKNLPGTVVLQKNFADANPFSYEYFTLNGKKENVCIRICNINRISYDIKSDGEILKASLPDISLFDSLANTYKNVLLTSPATDTSAGTKSQMLSAILNKDIFFCAMPATVKSPWEQLVFKITCRKDQIKTLSQNLAENLKQLDRFARFAKEVPIIIGSECCSQQNIKLRIGNQSDIKAFDPGINYNNIIEKLNNDVPAVFELVKKISSEINSKKEEIEKLATKYSDSECQLNQQDSITVGRGKKSKTYYRPRQIQSTCSEIGDLKQLSEAKELENNLAIAAKADRDDLAKSLSIINNLLAKVNNVGNFFYTKCFDKDDAEFINISFKAIPKDDYKTLLDSQVYKYKIPVKGRFKWAIGPSLNFHFGGTLISSTYSIDSARRGNVSNGEIMKDTFNVSLNAKRSRVIPYVGVMAHFYWQEHRNLTPGIAIGISISPTQFSDLRAYLGGSLIIGGSLKGKLIFSSGLAGGAVDRLKPNLVEGTNPKNRIIFNGNNLPSPDQLVEKVFRIGFFFGMTYNLKD